MIKVKRLVINKFRSLPPNEELIIGDSITLIAGQNGTVKSTLLGMICQPLGFPDPQQGKKPKADSLYTRIYDEVKLWEHLTLAGRPFKASYSDVFRMSKRYDKPRDHEYILHIQSDNGEIIEGTTVDKNGLEVRSEARSKRSNDLRFVTNSKSRKPGEGNYPHPVIYLGLERLRPLATCSSKEIISNKYDISADDDLYFIRARNEIFVEKHHQDMKSEKVDTGRFKNSYFSTQTSTYDGESASAGQDNIGQILTAIRSFHQLMKRLGNKYCGGILLIDEIDATLHPVAQMNLLIHLIAQCKELDLQVVATTHSLFLLEQACRQLKDYVTLVYLKKKDGLVNVCNNVDYDFISSDLTATLKIKEEIKTTVLLEDHVAAGFFHQITKNVFKDYIKIYNSKENNYETSLSNQVLDTLATIAKKKKIPEFQKMIFIMDGDSGYRLKNDVKNLLALPGKKAIEKLMYFHLYYLKEDDAAWEYFANGFTWQICFNRFTDLKEETNIDEFKKWFRQHSKCDHFGKKENSKLYIHWVKKHEHECKEFSLKLLDALSRSNPRVQANNDLLKVVIDKKFT